jgi:SAM-dependent methyltransferase
LSTGLPFEDFSRAQDLHHLSHRALVRELIPRWLRDGVPDLDDRIAGAAYGETPEQIQVQLIELLDLSESDIFLDLGAGAGGFMASVLSRGFRARGLEQNRRLVEAGHDYLRSRQWEPECLVLGDFLQDPWPKCSVVYCTTSRHSDKTLRELALKLERNDSIRAIGVLGTPLVLSSKWETVHRSTHQVVWNLDEPSVSEELLCWVRREPLLAEHGST